jgi:hypothetical protein
MMGIESEKSPNEWERAMPREGEGKDNQKGYLSLSSGIIQRKTAYTHAHGKGINYWSNHIKSNCH